MKKKVIKYTIFLLFIPLIASLIIAIATDGKGYQTNNDSYDYLDTPNYDKIENQVQDDSSYIYFSVFTFVIVSCGIWFYIQNKRGL